MSMTMALPQVAGYFGKQCAPIIEEPTTPELEAVELSIKDIDDQYYEDSQVVRRTTLVRIL